MTPRVLTILHLTHQGEGAGSTQSIFSLSRELARRGHRVLVGCPPETLLSRLVADAAPLTHVPLDFSRLGTVATAVAAGAPDHHAVAATAGHFAPGARPPPPAPATGLGTSERARSGQR